MSKKLEEVFDEVRRSIEAKVEGDIEHFLAGLKEYALEEGLSPDVTFAVSQYWIQQLVGDFHLNILAHKIPGEDNEVENQSPASTTTGEGAE